MNKNDDLVWYVSYGSNMLKKRFMCYLTGDLFPGMGRAPKACDNPSEPLNEIPFLIQYNMYFGNESGTWDGKGVSFLDITKPGKAYGVAYLITQEQYNHVCREENSGKEPSKSISWYNSKVSLGELNNIPVMTLTNNMFRGYNEPCSRYLEVLHDGIKDHYPDLSDEEITMYLNSRNEDKQNTKI